MLDVVPYSEDLCWHSGFSFVSDGPHQAGEQAPCCYPAEFPPESAHQVTY